MAGIGCSEQHPTHDRSARDRSILAVLIPQIKHKDLNLRMAFPAAFKSHSLAAC